MTDQTWSKYQIEAHRRLPPAEVNAIVTGDGPYLLLSKCRKPWLLHLFQDSGQRLRKLEMWDRGCCSSCQDDHRIMFIDLP